MTAKQISQIIVFINDTDIQEKEKNDLIEFVLNYSQNKRYENDIVVSGKCNEIMNIASNEPNNNIKIQGDNLPFEKEEQMLIQIPGASISKKPRKDGRYQGYILRRDGSKKYFYGLTRREVEAKIQLAIALNKNKGRGKRDVSFLTHGASFLDVGYDEAEFDDSNEFSFSNNKQKSRQIKNGHPFNEFYESWIENYKKPNVKPKSLDSIKTTLRRAVDKFGDTPIEMITTDDIQSLLVSINGGRMRDMCKINLSQIFKKAVVQEIIDRNPCDAVEIKKHKEQHKKALTLAEQDKFLAVTENTPHSLLFRLMLSTGLRIGEALALTKSDIDFKNLKLRVNKNVVFINSKRVVQDTPKSEAGNRTIPIPKDICDELKQIEGESLFPASYNAVKLWMNKMCKKEEMNMTLHTLRHTYATRLEEAGIPPKVKQYLLGHASLEMTQNTYTDTQESYVDSLSEKIRAVF